MEEKLDAILKELKEMNKKLDKISKNTETNPDVEGYTSEIRDIVKDISDNLNA